MNTCSTCNYWNKIGKGDCGRCEYVETDADTYHGAYLWGRGPDEKGLGHRFNGELRTLPTHSCAGWQGIVKQGTLGLGGE